MRALTAAQMHAADTSGMAERGETALMAQAGERLAEAIAHSTCGEGPVVAFAGPGGNGGDAFAALALLPHARQRIVYAMDAPEPSAARRDAEERARASGVEVRAFPADEAAAREALSGAVLALDGLLGTGSRPEPGAAMLPAIAALNRLERERVLAIDAPTGVDATTGATSAHAVRAGATVTLGAPKIGLLLETARPHVGALYVGDIGLGAHIAALGAPYYDVLTPEEFLALLPARGDESDKRSSGAPLVVAGSKQFPGAAVLCARGAARAGAGYVTLATSAAAADTIRTHLVEQVVVAYADGEPKKTVEDLLDLRRHSSAVALGPGLPLDEDTGWIVREFIIHLDLPFVADASALFHLSKRTAILGGKHCVLTPHAGEFARLSGLGTITPGERLERLRAFTTSTGVTTLLKGWSTLIDDGTTMHVNPTGTSALATAGTGDVLTGIISTLLAQGLSPVDAARAGAYWHGLAGQRAHAIRHVGVMAGDLPDALADALAGTPRPLGGLLRLF
jgi:NAD(P)H-hydrate epimerase